MRRAMFTPIVLLVLLVMGRWNYQKLLVHPTHIWRSPILYLMLISVVCLVLVLIPGIGREVNESRRWLKFGPEQYGLTFQPSELAKWCTAMFLAVYGWWMGDRMRQFRYGFLPSCALLGLVAGLIGKEDFGTAALGGAVGVAILLAAGVRWWHLLILIPLAALAFYVLVYCNEYRWNRIQAYLHGDDAPQEMASAYHAKQSIMAIGSGGTWGTGLGQGTVKVGWLPEDTTDFVFAVIGEELGFAGCVLAVGLYIIMMIVCMRIIFSAPDRLGRLVAFSIAATLGAQAAMNMLVVTGLAPTKGIALPFVSAGGTGLVITAAAAGVLVNIARQGMAHPTPEPAAA